MDRKTYTGNKLNWDHRARILDIYMPVYVNEYLYKFQHPTTSNLSTPPPHPQTETPKLWIHSNPNVPPNY